MNGPFVRERHDQPLWIAAIPASKGQDPLIAYHREAEARAWLRPLSRSEQLRVYLQAVQRGDIDIMRGVKLAPGGALIEQDLLDRIDQEHLERAEPTKWARLQTLDFSRTKLQTLAGAIEGLLGSYGQEPVFKTPPIKSKELGFQNTQAAPAKSAADALPTGGLKFQ